MNELRPPQAPRLADPGVQYSADTQMAMQRQLRTFFNQIEAMAQGLLGRRGGQHLSHVYAELTADATQTAASADTAYLIAFPGTSIASGVVLQGAPLTEIVPGSPGVYELGITLQIGNGGAGVEDLSVWLLSDGTAVSGSNTQVSVPIGGCFASLCVLANTDGTQVFEWAWSTTSTDLSLVATAVQTTPDRPATPAARASVRFVSTA